MDELFSIKANLRIVRLVENDARCISDSLKDLRGLIRQNEPMYPGIDKWFNQKVAPGIQSSQRVGYVGYLDEVPAISAVLKLGKNAKFCHLKIREDLQERHLGEAFFALFGLELNGLAREIHFTLPESLWQKEKRFFSSFGFESAIKAGHQYRLFEDELRCSAPFSKVWACILEKLPKIACGFSVNGRSFDPKLLMSIKPEHANKILSGEKKVEVRRRFSKKWCGYRVSIYACHPQCSIVGDAMICEVVLDKPQSLWDRFGGQIGCTKDQFDSYAASVDELYAIIFEDVVPYQRTVPLLDASRAVNASLRPPQSHFALANSKGWAEAVSLGALLQRSFGARQDIMI